MLTLTRKELETKKKLELLEEFHPDVLVNAVHQMKTEIQKGIITQEDFDEYWPIETKSFQSVMVVEDDLSKRLRLIRPQQVHWDETSIKKSIGEWEGVYMDTLRNREFGIVGMPYGYDIIKGKRAVIGEIRYYGGVPYRKVSATGNANKDWQVVKDMAKKPGAKGGEKHEEVKEDKDKKQKSLENISKYTKNDKKLLSDMLETMEVSGKGDKDIIEAIKDKLRSFKEEETSTPEKKDKPTKTMSPKDIAQLFKNKDDWGDLGDYVSVVDGKLQVIDSFYYGGAKRLENLKKDWVEEDGSYAKYFKEEYGIKFKLVESDVQDFATGKYKKLLGDNMGMVLIKLEVEPVG